MSTELIASFYEAFARRDADGMAAAYADDVRFTDPVFPDLRGERARDMWRMLCEIGKDLEITFGHVTADGARASARWEAHYTFSATGRRVHNVVDASFVVENGKIVEHVDRFDLWRWSGMALGVPGRLLGWSPPMKALVRRSAAGALDKWVAER